YVIHVRHSPRLAPPRPPPPTLFPYTTLFRSQRRAEYAKDITYGTNNEFGFDYLRDNMAWATKDLVQRGHHFAIVDEVDSILIDRSEEHTSELQSRFDLVCRLLLEKKNRTTTT